MGSIVSDIPWFVWIGFGLAIAALLSGRQGGGHGGVNINPPPTTPRPSGVPKGHGALRV
jgi:hypothetical protein